MSTKAVIKTKIWLSSPHMSGSELAYVQDAFKSNWIAPLGPNVSAFEDNIADYLGEGSFAATLSSGTAGIHLGLKLLGVGAGDIVLCQSFTFSASANPIEYLGATPVFVDSERTTWNMCPLLLEEAILMSIANGRKPKAIVAVHLYGMPFKVEEIKNISQKYHIPILEDAAEAMGSAYYGLKCGTFGDIGVLSFNGNKIITTSGGGALITKNVEIKKKAIYLATQARDEAPFYQHSEIGYNYRLSNVLAGIGRGQMEVLDDRVAARRNNFQYYKNALEGIEGIEFLQEPKRLFSNRWLTCILTENLEMREAIRLALTDENIECRPLWKPMHKQPVFSKCDNVVNGVSEDLFQRGLCLPSGSDLTEADLHRITEIILKTAK